MDPYTERHAGHLIVVSQDDCMLDFDDALGDAMPPVLYRHGGFRVSNSLTPRDILDLMSEDDLVENRSAILDACDFTAGDLENLVEDSLHYGSLEDNLHDLVAGALSDSDTELAAALVSVLGLPHCEVSETGFCQGDIIAGLCIATPDFLRARYGDAIPDRETVQRHMEADFETIGAWAFGQSYRGEVFALPSELIRLSEDEFADWLESLDETIEEVLGEPIETMDQLEMLPNLDNGPFITALRSSASQNSERSFDAAA